MLSVRLIPCLLLDGRGLVKTVRFKDPTYVGDPINAVKIYNDRFVDEIIFLDINASEERRGPDFEQVANIVSESFIPFCYGGGVRSVADADRLFALGVEKVAVNTAAVRRPELVAELAQRFGSQSIVAAMDVRRELFGRHVLLTGRGRRKESVTPLEHARRMAAQGAGELFVNAVDRDGSMQGFDEELVGVLVDAVNIPVIACGGAGSLADVRALVERTRVSAVACGSLFVFKGKHRGVLINYPSRREVKALLGDLAPAGTAERT